MKNNTANLILVAVLIVSGFLWYNLSYKKNGAEIIEKIKTTKSIISENERQNKNNDGYSEKRTKTIYLQEGWNPSQKIEIDLTPPSGYTKGMTCISCSGSGTKMYPYNERESICAACNGRGFDFTKI